MKIFFKFRIWRRFIVFIMLSFALLGCGGNDKKNLPLKNVPPVIFGIPMTVVALGQSYDFTPKASDPDGNALSYFISNKPEWANFDSKSGRLFGVATTEGVHSNILISVSDGVEHQVLDAFNITVISQASISNIDVVGSQQGVTPFISFVTLQGQQLNEVSYVEYTIEPKLGAISRAVHVKYSKSALHDRGYIPNPDLISVPVYGLYEGYVNKVLLTIGYEDSSSKAFSYEISTNQYEDPNKTYDRPVILKKRKMNSSLGFDFFAIKSLFGPPVIIDTDGELRWAAIIPEISSSASAVFHNGIFTVGDQASTNFFSFELDGKVRRGSLTDSSYTNFHHNIDIGKHGYLGEFDAEVNGIKNIESIIGDFDLSGTLFKEWDFSKILFDFMAKAGDDPSNFIRAGVDWFHSNAAVYDSEDNSLIVSSRENFVIKLDYETNDIIWILGDPTKYWYQFPSLRSKAIILDSGIYPIGQHAVSVTNDGLLLLFNNGAASFNQPSFTPVGGSRIYSAVSAYEIDPATLRGREAWRFNYNESILSDICSSVYEGGQQSLLITYATASERTKTRLVGLDKDREVIFDFEYPSSKICASWNAMPVTLENMNIM